MQNISPKDRHILETAAEHFAVNGYGGARMDEIAKDAKVNKATIYYRLGDKESLYGKVYALILDTLLSEVITSCDQINDPVVALKRYIKTIAQLCEQNPFMSRIVLREVASQGQHLSEETLEKMHQIRMFLTGILDKGKQSGQFNNVNPFMIHMLIIGFLNFYAAGKPIRERISDYGDNAKYTCVFPISQAADELAELILKSISTN